MKRILYIATMIAGLIVGPSLAVENAVLVDLSRTDWVQYSVNVPKSVREERCLTEAIYYEAGNQSEIGKEAVALVILNRVGQKHRPKTICGVIAQAHVTEDRKICQFSFWCENKYKPNPTKWEESHKIARRVLTNYWKRAIIEQYQQAIYFHADYVKPKWRKTKVFLGKIDNHLFYAEKP